MNRILITFRPLTHNLTPFLWAHVDAALDGSYGLYLRSEHNRQEIRKSLPAFRDLLCFLPKEGTLVNFL